MMQPERIAIFLPSLRGGGAERVSVLLANGFAARGFGVHMVLVRANGPYLSEVGADVRIFDLKQSRVITALPGLVRYLRRERPDAMLSVMSHANVLALAARRIAGVQTPLVITEHASTASSTWTSPKLRNQIIQILIKRSYRQAQAVVAVSSAMADDIGSKLEIDRSKLLAIHNPVVTERLVGCATQVPQHSWFDDEQRPVILAVGRLTEAKDFPTLVRAMVRLRAEGRPERLIILGEGDERSRLEHLIAELGLNDRVDLPGFVTNPFAFMSRAALFVLSSRWEGLPTVLIEAMACGAPIVSTDCPTGPAEILENGKWGALVPVGDADALAQAMIEMLDRQDRPDVRERAADFGEDRAVSRYLEVLGLGNS